MKSKLLIIAIFTGHLTSTQVKVQLDNQITLTLPDGASVVTDYAKLGNTNEMTELVLKKINKYVYKVEDIIIRFSPAKYQGDKAYLIKTQAIYRKWYASKKK